MDSPLHLVRTCQLIIASDACLSQHRRWANIVRRKSRTNLLHLSNSAWQIMMATTIRQADRLLSSRFVLDPGVGARVPLLFSPP
jgi:hypothetical protein